MLHPSYIFSRATSDDAFNTAQANNKLEGLSDNALLRKEKGNDTLLGSLVFDGKLNEI